VVFDANTLRHLSNSLAEAKQQNWDILYLGGHCWDNHYPLIDGCEHLRYVTQDKIGPTCTHALVYNQSIFNKLLSQFPEDTNDMENYLAATYPAIDQLLSVDRSLKRLVCEPRVASQPPLLIQESKYFTSILEV